MGQRFICQLILALVRTQFVGMDLGTFGGFRWGHVFLVDIPAFLEDWLANDYLLRVCTSEVSPGTGKPN